MADLITRITETLTLNGVSQGGITTKTITGINDVYKRIIEVPSTEITLYTTNTTDVGGSQFESDLIEYVRITNLDSSNSVTLIIDATGDEAAIKLSAGSSFLLTKHESVLEGTANTADVTVTDGIKSIQRVTVADGDAASGMAENEYITLVDSKGVSKKYVVVDDNTTTVATGDILESTSDTGASTAGSANAGGIAVAINLPPATATTQNGFLVQLKAAIEHANGQPDFTVASVPGEADGAQNLDITSNYKGDSGNTVPVTDISQLTVSVSTSGVDASVAGLSTITTVFALAETSSSAGSKIEIFIASK